MLLDCLWLIGRVFLPWRFDQDSGPDRHPDNRRGVVAALILLVALVFVSLHIITALRQSDRLQDCV